MNYTKCTGTKLAIEYNENYLDNVKLACYCPYCCLTTEREPTPYKIIKTDDGFIEIFDESYQEKKDKIEEKIKMEEENNDPKDAYDYVEELTEDAMEDLYDYVNDFIEDEYF